MKERPLKVAIVHDWLVGGGAERVVETLHQMFPQAPIYTSYCTPAWRERLNGKVRTGFLQHWPFGSLRKYVGVLRIWWFTHLNLKGYDLVISSSGAEAKGVKIAAGTVYINYCHAPTHYYWSRYDEYLAHPGFGVLDPLARLGLKLLVAPLRHWDYKAAQRPQVMIANSTHIANEIQKYYGREAEVVHPPVDIARFEGHEPQQRLGFVIAGRQTPYKRVDLAVAACTQLNLPLMVVGNGPDHDRLANMAGPSITFDTAASDEDVAQYLRSALALIFPNLDDFGITPIEAMAAGTPVIAYQAGGALDYVVEGRTGLFFTPQTVEALRQTLQQFDPKQFNHQTIREAAAPFSPETFQTKMNQIIADTLKNSSVKTI